MKQFILPLWDLIILASSGLYSCQELGTVLSPKKVVSYIDELNSYGGKVSCILTEIYQSQIPHQVLFTLSVNMDSGFPNYLERKL